MYKLLIIILLILIQLPITAQNQTVTIQGEAKQYRGLELYIKAKPTPLSMDFDTLARFRPDDQGHYTVSFQLAQTQRLEIELLALNGILYARPGDTYILELPERIETDKTDNYNPFFTPAEVYLGVTNQNGKDLNNLISNLEDSIRHIVLQPMEYTSQRNSAKKIEALIQRTNNSFTHVTDPYFVDYKNFRYHTIRFSTYQRNEKQILNKYFDTQIKLQVSTYWTLLDLVAPNALNRYTFAGDTTLQYLQSEPTKNDRLSENLDKKLSDNQQFHQLFIIKGLFDAFYKSGFPKPKILKLLQSYTTQASTAELRKLATEAYNKINFLRPGTAAPNLSFLDTEGNTVRLNQFWGKYVYLCFGTSWSVPMQREMPLLKQLADKNIPNFAIVTVSMDNEFSKMKTYCQTNQYNWPIWHWDYKPEVAKSFEIRTFPTCYLIDPDGNLKFSPAPLLSEGFREQFQPILDQMRRDSFKNQGVKKQ